MREDFSGFLTLNLSHKICTLFWDSIKILSAFRRKSQWEVKGPHSCTGDLHAERNAFQSLNENYYGQKKEVQERKQGFANLQVLKLKKNKTVLEVELKQIITAGGAKWGPDNRAAAENRAKNRLVTGRQNKLQCQVLGFDFSEKHLHIIDKICWGEVQSQSQIYFSTASLFTLLPKKPYLLFICTCSY